MQKSFNKSIRSALKRPMKITKFVTNITYCAKTDMMTNLNFNYRYEYFDAIFIYAGNTFLSSIVLG